MESRSLGDMLRRSVRIYGDKPAVLMPVKGEFVPITYRGYAETVRRYAGVLRELGVKRGDRIAILSENAPEWAMADWAAQTLGAVFLGIYPTLPPDQVEYIVKDSGASLLIAGSVELAKKFQGLPNLKLVLLTGADDALSALALTGSPKLSEEDWNHEIDATGPEDLATIIYTSGTTGVPKGAMMPHRAFIHVAETVRNDARLGIGDKDLFYSFLPMSHVYERVAGQFMPLGVGATIAYAKSLASIGGDLVKLQPTIMLCVPRFLESFRDRVLDGVAKAAPLRQKLFRLALGQGVKKARGHFAPLAMITDKFVMSKIREKTGGRIYAFVSGGAALAPAVAEFYMALGLNVLQGYGLTETSGGSVINRPDDNKYWTVGESLGTEIKLAEDGEILLRGPGLMTGYYNQPEETAAAVDSEGWFKTGDIGEFEGKHLKITDRKKDLLVLGNGKNVAPQPIENKLKSSEFISEAVVLGDGMEYCIALIILRSDHVRQHLGLGEIERLSDNDQVKALIKGEVDKINKTLASFELVKKHAILEDPFTVESGELTPTLKVKRKVVKEKYADIIRSLGR